MIKAEKAHRIMQLYESDYDNFLEKLKAKSKTKKAEAQQKKAEAQQKKVEADKADKTVVQAEAHKKKHLGQKAKELLNKAGGIKGAQSTVQNVMKYFKNDAPSNFEMNVGGPGEEYSKAEKTIFGLPPIAVYAGGAVLVLAGLYGLSQMNKNAHKQTRSSAPARVSTEQVLQAA